MILRTLLKIPAIWCVIEAAHRREGGQYLLKVVWRLELREQLGTFVTGRLLTQNDGEKKKKNNNNQLLAFENRLLCCPVMN